MCSSDLSNTQSVEVLMRSETGFERITLPEKMLERIAQYIREESKSPLKDFDCSSFVHFVADVPHEFAHFDAEKWNITPLDESALKAGDIAMIVDTDNPASFETSKIMHLAIYLGSNLYISKFGDSGKLIIANMEEMKKGFNGNHGYQITLRDNLPDATSIPPSNTSKETEEQDSENSW